MFRERTYSNIILVCLMIIKYLTLCCHTLYKSRANLHSKMCLKLLIKLSKTGKYFSIII